MDEGKIGEEVVMAGLGGFCWGCEEVVLKVKKREGFLVEFGDYLVSSFELRFLFLNVYAGNSRLVVLSNYFSGCQQKVLKFGLSASVYD